MTDKRTSPDPVKPDDQAELDAALAELERHYIAPEDIDPETRALAADPELKASIEERRRIAEMPDPAAPEPVELPAETGVLIVQAEAAATYVAPVEVTLPEAPRVPSGPVRLRTDLDPRRQKTVRVARKGGLGPSASAGASLGAETSAAESATGGSGAVVGASGPEIAGVLPGGGGAVGAARSSATGGDAVTLAGGVGAGMGAGELASAEAASTPSRSGRSARGGRGPATVAAPSAPEHGLVAASARSRGEGAWSRMFLLGAMIFVAGGIAVYASLRPPERAPDAAVTAPVIGTAAAPSAVATSVVAASAARVEAPPPAMDAATTSTAASAAPTSVAAASSTGAAVVVSAKPSAAPAPSVTSPPPSVTSPPSAAPIAGAPPVGTSSPAVTSSPSVPPPPVATSAPRATAAPSTSSTSKPFVPYVPEKD